MRLVFISIVLIIGCTQKDKYPVRDIELGPEYYIGLLGEVKDQLGTAGEDQKVDLLYKKLFISQQLRWPEDVSDELTFLMNREGLTYELYQYAADFYQSSHYYERLLNLVDRWAGKHHWSAADQKYQIAALKGLNREEEAKHLLWNFLQAADDPEDLKYIAGEYLDFKDTARALNTFSRLARNHPHEQVLRQSYIPLLIEAGYPQRAKDLLQEQQELVDDVEARVLMARILFDLGEPYEAIAILRQQEDSTHYLQIARWYQSLKAYDSAIYYTDRVIAIDSSRQALLTKGDIYEQRGWLNTAYQTFSALIRQDTTDSIAINRAGIVARKIAYLRSKQESERVIPVLNIPIKKSTENE